MIRRTLALASAIAVVSAAPFASAEAEISVLGGYHAFSSDNPLGRRGTEPRTRLTSGAMFGARLAYLPTPRYGVELEVAIIPTSSAEGSGVNVPSARLTGVWNLTTGRVRPSLLVGVAGVVASPSDPLLYTSDLRPAVVGGSSLHVDVGSWWGLRFDARMFAFEGIEGRSFAFDRELTLSVFGRFPAPPPPEERGRGPLIADRDHDGVGDALDKCPDVEGPVKNYGCPPNLDRDNDGIVDKEDKCPDLPGIKALAGCKDSDGDGIIDPKDKCPTEAGIAALKGCADKDTDGDGIVDRLDKCPDVVETKNGFQDEDGCADVLPPEPPKPKIANLDRVDFDKGAATILATSLPVLDSAAKILGEHPEVYLVEIVGHSDDRGTPEGNMQLSRERADSVRDYLIKRGVAPARLVAIGKGSTEPIAPNTTEEGRKKNRRVEFRMKTKAIE